MRVDFRIRRVLLEASLFTCLCVLVLCVYCYCLAYIRHFWMWVVEILSVVSNQKTVVSDLLVCVFQGEVNFFQSRKHVLEHLTDMFFFPLVKDVKFETLLLKPDPH